jgi:cellulose synthase/poly-beta-1,6-N-acetylglucosamine synthase-like glycosyltransferase
MTLASLVPVFITTLSFYVTGVTAYLFLLAVAAYFFKKKVEYGGKPLRLVVVIPAHNEEEHISETVGRLKRSSYKASLFAVVVIADNCDDLTEAKALRAGADVFGRTNQKEKGKGQALDWFFTHHREAYAWADAVVLIDADTTVDKDFLLEIAASLKHPSVKAVQGYYGVSNPREHWRSGLVSAAFHVFNHLRPAGCNRLGGSAGLRGNGMGLRTELLLGLGWPAHSIVEDHEFTLRLLLKQVVVYYNPDARVYSDMPSDRKVAEKQRMRWEGMRRGMRNRFVRLVLKELIRRPRVFYVHTLLGFFVPPFAKVVMWQLVLFGVSAFIAPRAAFLMAVCFGADFFYVLSGLVLRGAGRAEWLSLCRAPFYLIWKLGVYIKMINRAPTSWERTKRASELK